MNMHRQPIDNSYERLALNLAELIYDLEPEQEEPLRDLLIRAYQEAYRRAATETEATRAPVAAG